MDKDKVKGTAAYIQRALQDDFVQDQFRTMASELRSTVKRAKHERGRSVEDKKLYASVRQAAISARNLVHAFARPEPEPKHRGRKLVVIVLSMAGAMALTVKLQKVEAERRREASSVSSASPVVAGESAPEPGVVAGSTA